MADNDDFTVVVEGEDGGEGGEGEGEASTIASSEQGQAGRVPHVEDDEALEEAKKAVRRQRGRATLDHQSVCLVLHLFMQLKQDNQRFIKKTGRTRRMSYAREVARLVGCSSKTASDLYRNWYIGRTQQPSPAHVAVPLAGLRGNFKRKNTRIPMTKRMGVITRRFVRRRRLNQQRITATQVLREFIRLGLLSVEPTSERPDKDKNWRAGLRATQVFLRKQGFVHGIREDAELCTRVKALVADYLGALLANRAKPPAERRREVYLDESYIHEHTFHDGQNLFHPNDEADKRMGAVRRGRRWCFALAIQGPNPRAPEGRHLERDRAGVVPRTLWVFTPDKGSKSTHQKQQQGQHQHQQTKRVTRRCRVCRLAGHNAKTCPSRKAHPPRDAHKQCQTPRAFEIMSSATTRRAAAGLPGKTAHRGDYHRSFTGESFEEWFRLDLLPQLGPPCLIIMDNASYHKTLPASTPKPGRMKKAELAAALRTRGESVEETELRPTLCHRLAQWIRKHVKPSIVQLAEAQGHRVLFTPPKMCELQPIERVWGVLKGRVARHHHKSLDYSGTLDLLHEEAIRIHYETHRDGRNMIGAIIESCDGEVERYRKLMELPPTGTHETGRDGNEGAMAVGCTDDSDENWLPEDEQEEDEGEDIACESEDEEDEDDEKE